MAFYDKDTDTVYIAAALHRHKKVFEDLHKHLQNHNINIAIITDTDNIWVRDWLCLQVGGHFVKFGYGYADKVKQYPQLAINPFVYSKWLVTYSGLTLDGGNCQRYGDKAIISDIVYKHHPWLKKKEIRGMLEEQLEAQVIIVPKEPWDDLGHTDGLIKWVDEDTVLVNDFQSKYGDKLLKSLRKHNLECIPFPWAYAKMPKMTEKEFRAKLPMADTWNPGFGYYINILEVKGLILAPQFGIEEDQEVLNLLAMYFPDCAVEGIDCADLSMEGGLINCVTMNYKAAPCSL